MPALLLPFYHPILARPRSVLRRPPRCLVIMFIVALSIFLILVHDRHPQSMFPGLYVFHPWRLFETNREALEERLVLLDGIAYDAFRPPPAAEARADPRVRSITAHVRIPDACLDTWVSTGIWQAPCENEMVEEAQIDLVYAWINGSDPLQAKGRQELLQATVRNSTAARFREHDELRYSLRAAHEATTSWPNRTWHIVSADVEDPRSSNRRHSRLGLVPQWLDVACAAGHEEPRIRLHHDTQIFRLTADPGEVLTEGDAENWLRRVVPSFNSHAIESQLAHLDPEVVSDNIVAFNDDQFLILPTPPSAFHTTLYGPVFRVDANILIEGDSTGKGDADGEWRSLPWSAQLLNERFGKRPRPYIKHNARALSLPLLHEAALAFGRAFAVTPFSRFRGSHNVHREWEVNTIFLATHFVIERHREALLWSWVVGKWGVRAGSQEGGGGREGVLDRKTKQRMWKELKGLDRQNKMVQYLQARRPGMEDAERALKRAGIEPPQPEVWGAQAATRYWFVSMNGYSPSYRSIANAATIERGKCIGADYELAWDMFRRLMLDIKCADNIISALLYDASAGLEVFLPDASPSSSPNPSDPITLPLTLPLSPPPLPTNPRVFAVRLLQRYAYVLGESEMFFMELRNAPEAKQILDAFQQKTTIPLLCINDNLGEDEQVVEATDVMLREWFKSKWPKKLRCEI